MKDWNIQLSSEECPFRARARSMDFCLHDLTLSTRRRSEDELRCKKKNCPVLHNGPLKQVYALYEKGEERPYGVYSTKAKAERIRQTLQDSDKIATDIINQTNKAKRDAEPDKTGLAKLVQTCSAKDRDYSEYEIVEYLVDESVDVTE